MLKQVKHLLHQEPKRLLITFVLLMAAMLAISGVLDEKGQNYTNQVFSRALLTFGIAKGLNGVISVAQGTELAVEPAGIGVVFTPGQILDPINDLVERFSWVMLLSLASIGVQKILLGITAWTSITVITVSLIGLSIILLWYRHANIKPLRPWVMKAMLLMLLLRFSVVAIAIASELIYQQFLQQEYTEAATQLGNTADHITTLSETQAPAATSDPQQNKSLIDKTREIYNSATNMLNIRQRIDQLKYAADEATRHTINLIVVFIFQTVLLPIGFLFGIYQTARLIIRYKPD